jgi:pyruvate dehydrogenase E2 component (dihydrolipoamide acetyltransferase)
MVFLEEGRAETPSPAGPKEERKPPLEPRVPSTPGTPASTTISTDSASAATAGPVPAAPSTRRLARELGVDLHRVLPTGPGGRVTAEDVRAFAEGRQRAAEVTPPFVPPTAAVESPPGALKPSLLPDFGRWGPVTREPLRSVRRATARHMALAWAQIPHVTHQDVVDITELESLRRHHKQEIQAQKGVLSLTVFAMKAAVAALKAHPRFNASLDGDSEEIILKHYYHIGVAVDTERGLIVPVVRDVDRKSITQLAMELNDLVVRGRAGKIEREEMIGGTFTITNIGVLGGTAFTPIVNYPEVAILGMARAGLQPVVKGDDENSEIVPRFMLPLILGFDHRVVDGADAARFLGMIMDTLGNPEKLLMMI